MDETNPVYENFRNKMRAFGEPIRGTTRKISASKFLGKEREGSGIVIDDEGHVLTIGYLVLEAGSVEITDVDNEISELLKVNNRKTIETNFNAFLITSI